MNTNQTAVRRSFLTVSLAVLVLTCSGAQASPHDTDIASTNVSTTSRDISEVGGTSWWWWDFSSSRHDRTPMPF